MALRGRIQDSQATFEDPILGVNLHKAEEDLHAGESSNMKNMVHYGRLTSRRGSTQLTASQVASSKAVLGGHKFYYNDIFPSGHQNHNRTVPISARFYAYDTNIVKLTDGGVSNSWWTSQTADKITHFATWATTNQCYVSNGEDPLLRIGEIDSGDDITAGPIGGVLLTASTHAWTQSPAQTTEYYCTLAGGDPSLTDPTSTGGVYIEGALATKGTAGSLAVNEWDYADNDTLGYSTIYVRVTSDANPETRYPDTAAALALFDWGIWIVQSSTAVPGVGTNPPAIQTMPLVDRLFAITSNGIERTDPRDPNIWSLDSSWATLRPSQGGTFTAMIPHMVSSQEGQPIHGALAMTSNAYYFFTGTYFGVDVTASTGADSVGEAAGNPAHDNASIQFIDNIGAFHAKSMVTVPGVGTFWITTNKNIFYVQAGTTQGRLIGNRIVNTGGSATVGLESMDLDQGTDAWMTYYEPYLMIGFTITGDTYPQYQYWLDMDKFRQAPANPVWYGPMTGQSISTVWQENAQGDNAILGGEANTSTGVFVYNLQVEDTYTDAVGTADNSLACEYSTYMKSGGAPSREKVVQGIEVEMNTITGSATADVGDITGTILSGLPVEKTFT